MAQEVSPDMALQGAVGEIPFPMPEATCRLNVSIVRLAKRVRGCRYDGPVPTRQLICRKFYRLPVHAALHTAAETTAPFPTGRDERATADAACRVRPPNIRAVTTRKCAPPGRSWAGSCGRHAKVGSRNCSMPGILSTTLGAETEQFIDELPEMDRVYANLCWSFAIVFPRNPLIPSKMNIRRSINHTL